jgi:hypothetical protein
MKKARHLCGGLTVNDIVSTAVSRAVWKYAQMSFPKETLSSVIYAGGADARGTVNNNILGAADSPQQ